MQILVAINENGRRIGENHPLAKLTDAEVELVHALRDEGLSLLQIASKLDVSKGCVWKILNGYRRSQTAVRVVAVSVAD